MKKLSYNEWHIYLAKELEKDYVKLNLIPKQKKMKTSFKQYHQDNPQIYQEFKKLAFQLINRGYIRLGSKQIFEVIRWQTMVSGNDRFKINNNYTSDYARLFENDHPIYSGYFSKRLCKLT